MKPTQWGLLLAAAVLMFWVLGAHNRLMALRAAVAAAWVQLDTALTQRSAAVALLIQALRGHFAHEHATLDALLVANTQVDDAAASLRQRPLLAERAVHLIQAEATMASSLSRTVALVQQRPELISHPQLQPLVQAVAMAEPQLAFGRQLFNQAAQAYNEAACQLPTRLVARLFSFGQAGRL